MDDLEEEEIFFHEIVVGDPEIQPLVDKSFKVFAINNIISAPGQQLEYTIRFEPFRPFKVPIELLIYKTTGGRWKYHCILDAREPEPDDTITIECEMNKTACVSFKLTN
jgi:hypothetical protein